MRNDFFENEAESETNGTGEPDLIRQAQSVARNAYAPYSNFRVGAAVLGERGTYLGTNVENASSGLSLCAERSALAAAVAAGETKVLAVAVACIDATGEGRPPGALLPCGACRQWLAELAPDAKILVAADPHREYRISDLLPNPFQLR